MKDASHKGRSFAWEDPFLLNDQLEEDERMIRETARAYAQDRLMPRIDAAYQKERTDPSIYREMCELGLLGVTQPEEYGGVGTGYVSYGLVAREVERVDSGYRSMMSVQSSLVMYPIHPYGSEAHGGPVRGFVLEVGITGPGAPKIGGKPSLRASISGEIMLDGVEVGEDALLPGVEGMGGPLGCLNRAGAGHAWRQWHQPGVPGHPPHDELGNRQHL